MIGRMHEWKVLADALNRTMASHAPIVLAGDPCESGVAVPRLIKEQNAWRVDPSFTPARAR
jgi:hypothetical protein